MPLDRTTEAIAHFIGEFHLDLEALRLREGYDAFRAQQDSADADFSAPQINISIRAPYDLKGFDPELTLSLPAGAAVPGTVPAAPAAARDIPGPDLHGQSAAPVSAAPPPMQAPAGFSYHWLVPPPNSIVTVTSQSLVLSDNDSLTFGHHPAFVDTAHLDAWLVGLAGTADSLALGLGGLLPPGQVPAIEGAGTLLDALDGLVAPQAEGADVVVLRGEAASGIVLGGGTGGEMPDFIERLPASLRPEEEGDAPDLPAMTPLGDDPDPFEVAPGHHVSTGGNLSVNEAIIATNWVDAGVIAVAGDVIDLDVISQVAVLVEGTGGGATLSKVVNAAQIATQSSRPERAEDAEGAAAAASNVLPVAWQMTRVEGDVVQVNWVQQNIFATDNDRIEVMFSASATSITMGANTLSNLTTILELGFHYDLIIVGGDMISVNLIEQSLVLLDVDSVAGEGAGQFVSGGGNYLQNSASISTVGKTEMTGMTETMRADLDALAGGAETISAALAADGLFAGSQTLSVLYIAGDLVEVNVVEQRNHVGDADQVYLALQEFLAQGDDGVTVATGENALLNAARIVDEGVDSVVMAGGQVYSDALIHQAELIDTDAMPDGVTLAGLASEAVAFLAADMIDAAPELEEGAGADMGGGSGHLDVMQTLLS